MQRGERVAAVEKIEDLRKPDDFFGHRKRLQAPYVVSRGLQSVGAFRKYAGGIFLASDRSGFAARRALIMCFFLRAQKSGAPGGIHARK